MNPPLSREPPDRLRVLELGGSFGLGGTDQAVEIRIALLPREFFDVTAVALAPGPRYRRLLARGVRGLDLGGSIARLDAALAETKPHVLHYTRADRNCGYSAEVQRLAAAHRVPVVVETNVFGRPPSFPEPRPPDRTCHMSLSSMLRCARLEGTRVRELFLRGHRAVYLPVPTIAGYAPERAPDRSDARRTLGVAPNEVLACRVARPDMRKWSVRLERALPRLFAEIPRLRFAFMAAPEPKLAALRRRFGDRVLGLAADADLSAVARVYAASDFMLHGSGIGESFGLSMAEAMHAGLPVVVDSTPDMDNAQVEVVDHERTGFVVASSAGFVEAAKRLAFDTELRKTLGASAADAARTRFSDLVVVRSWQGIYAESCDLAGLPLPGGLSRELQAAPKLLGADEYAAFEAEYERRVANVLGPGSELAERAACAVIRSRDMLWYARALGPSTVWRVLRSRLRTTGTLARN